MSNIIAATFLNSWTSFRLSFFGFLRKYGLEKEVKLNIEQGHAILAGHSFEHELALAASEGMLGSIDMNRNDYQSGWDTDQFPNNTPEVALAYYHVLKSGGFTTGGTNFDAKLRRQSIDPEDLIAAHVGGMDICARDSIWNTPTVFAAQIMS